MLDARAGSPPCASELLRRHAAQRTGLCALETLLADWERWAADLMESHLSYSVLSFYRSQHDRQSWLASLTCLLDTSALVIAGIGGSADRQARLTFAMCRHALIDLTLIFNTPPIPCAPDRLTTGELALLVEDLSRDGIVIANENFETELIKLRAIYEPYANALSTLLMVDLPPWRRERPVLDNWEASAWEKKDAAADDWILHPRN